MRAKNSVGKVQIPLGLRLNAWWEGHELQVRVHKPPETGTEPDKPRRELDRPTLLQEIWGRGLSGPEPKNLILHLVKPLGLTASTSVTLLGAGLGGAARIMVENFGCWVKALEPDKALASAGLDLAAADGDLKRVEVIRFDLESGDLESASADCAVSLGVFCGLEAKARILESSYRALKGGGQLLFTDFVLREGVKANDLGSWPHKEASPPFFWNAKTYEALLAKQRFDLRINEDLGAQYCKNITSAWAAFSRSDLVEQLGPKTAEMVLTEAEFWANRVKAIEDGKLTVRRFFALKTYSTVGTLTDW